MSIKPRLRDEARAELASQLNGILDLINKPTTPNRHPYKSCLSCLHFDENTAYCALWKGVPPPRVIVFACDKHDDTDDIPF